MRFEPTALSGAYIVDVDRIGDDRGFFARAWCKRELDALGLDSEAVQANLSFNVRKGTLRGMHFQLAPHQETKLVRCTRGALFDVIVDLRPNSATYKQWLGVELTAENHRSLFVPKGFAHGYQTLQDDTEVFYLVTEFYTPGAEGGARFDDPGFSIHWPLPVSVISNKDAAWPDFDG